MPDVLLGQAFAFEDMPEMAVAVFTENFDSKSVRVTLVPNGSRKFVIEARPPTP